jgi:hypothetical protein
MSVGEFTYEEAHQQGKTLLTIYRDLSKMMIMIAHR